MKLSIFDYATCINPRAETPTLKLKLHQHFFHDGDANISTLTSSHPIDFPTIFKTVSALFTLSQDVIVLKEKRCYQDFILYIVSLPTPLPPFLITVTQSTQPVDMRLIDHIHLIPSFYNLDTQSIESVTYYASSFDAYMTATNIPGITSYWVSPTTALSASFKIRAKTQNDRMLRIAPNHTLSYHNNLPNEDIASLNQVLKRIENAFPPNSSAKHAIQMQASKLIAIAKADCFGDLKIAYSHYVDCLSAHADKIKLKPPSLKKPPKPPSLFKRFKGIKQTTKASKMPCPLSITLRYLHKQLDELGLSNYLLIQPEKSGI